MRKHWVFLLGLGLLAPGLHGQSCVFTFAPGSFSFSVPVGSSISQTFRITPVSGSINFTFTPTNPQFTVSPASRTSSTPFDITLTFRPVLEDTIFGEGVRMRGTQTGRDDCSDFLGGPATGTPGFLLSTSSLDFGAVAVGQSGNRTFSVTPSSTLDFTITVNGAGFSATPPSFQAQSPRTISVTFTPASAGAQAAQVVVNAPGVGVSRTVNASGTGTSPAPPLTITTQTVPPALLNQTYSARIVVAGGTPPYQFSVIGSLPPGLEVRSSTGEITGVPRSAGDFTFGIRVTDSSGATASQQYSISVSIGGPAFSLSTSSLDFGDVPIGGSSARTLVITPISPVDIEMNLLGATEFSLAGESTFTIQSPRTVTLQFSPQSAGSKGWTILVNAPNAGFNRSVELRGNGLNYRETIIPHSAFGAGFLAQVFITNLAAANEVTVSRFAQSGAVIDSTVRTLPANGTIVIAQSEQQRNQPLTVQWARIDSQQPIASSILFDAAAGENRTVVGALASPRLSRFTVPLRVGPGATGGVALANPMNVPVQVALRMLDGGGNERVQDSLTLAPLQQTSFVVTDREPFRGFLCPQFPACQEFNGSLRVNTVDESHLITAMVVGSQQDKLFSLPVAPTPASGTTLIQGLLPPSAYQTVIPHSAFGGGFLTRLMVSNLDAANSNAITIFRFSQSGAQLEATPVQLAPGGTVTIADAEDRRALPLTVQWVAITSERPVTASIVFDSASGSDRTAVGALSSPALTRFAMPLRVGPASTGGVALLNLSNAQNTVSLVLADQNGATRATDSVVLDAYQQITFVATERPALRQFLCPGSVCQEFVGSLAVTTAGGSQPVASMVVGSQAGQLYSLPVSQTP